MYIHLYTTIINIYMYISLCSHMYIYVYVNVDKHTCIMFFGKYIELKRTSQKFTNIQKLYVIYIHVASVVQEL